jgi:hypothetical protein
MTKPARGRETMPDMSDMDAAIDAARKEAGIAPRPIAEVLREMSKEVARQEAAT